METRLRRTIVLGRGGEGKSHGGGRKLTLNMLVSSARVEEVHGGRNRQGSTLGSEKETSTARTMQGLRGRFLLQGAQLDDAETMLQMTEQGELHSGAIDGDDISRVSGGDEI